MNSFCADLEFYNCILKTYQKWQKLHHEYHLYYFLFVFLGVSNVIFPKIYVDFMEGNEVRRVFWTI